MEEGKAENFAFPDLVHIGMVVRDVVGVEKRLASLGIGPFEPYHKRLGIVSPVERKLRGKPTDCKLMVMVAQAAPLLLEITQPEGKCIQSEFLETRGEGLHHLGFYVDDLEADIARLAKQGLTPVMQGNTSNGTLFVFYEPEKAGGIVFELVKRPAQENRTDSSGEKKSPFSKIDMVGVVVRDVDAVIERLSPLGIGPFESYQHPSPLIERRLHNRLVEAKLRIAVAKVGQVELQLQQPEQGECLQKEVLDKKGEGFLHLGAYVDDLDKEVADLDQQGLSPSMQGSTAEGRLFVFYEPEDAGGVILELAQRSV